MYIQAQQTQERYGRPEHQETTETCIYGTANSRKVWKYQNIKKQLKLVYINIIFFYLTCTYRHSKLKKGMEVPEHQETTETCI